MRPDTLTDNKIMKATREGFGEGLLAIGSDERVYGLCADLTESVQMHHFAKAYTNRYIEMGIAEQNMAAVAAGIASMGMIPYIASYAAFNPGRNWEQIRTTIAYNNVPVRIIGAHAGLSVGPDGGSHQMLEDIALMRVMPNMTVLVPVDAIEAKAMTIASLEMSGPVYIRLSREKSPLILPDNYVYNSEPQILYKTSKTNQLKKLAIITCGPIAYEVLKSIKEIESHNIELLIINLSTIKPPDEKFLLNLIKSYSHILTVEEHQINGGLGSAIAEFVVRHGHVKMDMIGVKDRFGQSGKTDELYSEYEIDSLNIIDRAVTLVF